MLRPRLSPTLLIHDGGLVKTEGFAKPRYIGDPINAVRIFNEKEVDEIIVFDIDATVEAREPDFGLIELLAIECRMPLCYGGGLHSVAQARRLIGLGVEKVAIGAAAIARPALISELASEIGRQSVCVVIDTKARRWGHKLEAVTHHGTRKTGMDPIAIALQMTERGAGEIIFNSIDRDGSMKGYDLEFAAQARDALATPFTMLGGAGSWSDLADLVRTCGSIGVSAGSLFVFKGALRAVLINYPDHAKRDELSALAGAYQ